MLTSPASVEPSAERLERTAAAVAASATANTSALAISPRGSVVVDARTNSLILTDTAPKLAAIRDLIELVDIPVRQVMIEARIVIAQTDAGRNLGIEWGGAAVNIHAVALHHRCHRVAAAAELGIRRRVNDRVRHGPRRDHDCRHQDQYAGSDFYRFRRHGL